jgi:uncharacterized protein
LSAKALAFLKYALSFQNMKFEWDAKKAASNLAAHGVSFGQAVAAFDDPRRLILPDPAHSEREARFFCVGRVGEQVLTVRFTLRSGDIRLIGAAHWRKFTTLYHAHHES